MATHGIVPVLKTYTGVSTWAVLQVMGQTPREFRCLTDVLHPCVFAQLHITMEASQFSQGLCFHPWNHQSTYTEASACALTHPCQQLALEHKWESQTLAASPLGPIAETDGRINGMRCHLKPSSGGEAHIGSMTTLPTPSQRRSRDRTVQTFHPEGHMGTHELYSTGRQAYCCNLS